jgi:hypothetical protein
VTKALKADGLMPAIPDDGDAHGSDWHTLLTYRDGLVHGSASGPETSGQPKGVGPTPSVSDLDGLCPGWAVRIVAERIRRLHSAAGADPPEWVPPFESIEASSER